MKKLKILVTTLLFFGQFSTLHSAEIPQLQPAGIYNKNIKLEGYFVSEKYDGVRAFWNGKELITRKGNVINAPIWFTANFPKEALDGELWIDRGKFEIVSGIARKQIPDDEEWKSVKYMVFDMPQNPEIFENRLRRMEEIIPTANSPYLQMVKQSRIYSDAALHDLLLKTIRSGGEGLMLRKADSLYKINRNSDLLKVKTYQDAEAIVLRYTEGKGKYTGMVGALIVENQEDKITFSIGSGLTDEQRKNPPQIGSTITYRYQGKTKNGIPRFPVFLKERND